MNYRKRTDDRWQAGCGAGIFHAIFRVTAIADLYGPERAVEWAETLLDDPHLLAAFARGPRGSVTEMTVRRLPSPGSASARWN